MFQVDDELASPLGPDHKYDEYGLPAPPEAVPVRVNIPLEHTGFGLAVAVTAGNGLTVIVIVYGEPAQEPIVDVGVTIYWTEPAVAPELDSI